MLVKLETATDLESDPTSWQREVSACNDALSNADYDRACEMASEAIARLFRTRYVELLNIRAAAYGRRGYFDKAAVDAQQIIRNAPTSAIGYLQAGELYSMQGRHAAAIDIYTIGMERCVDYSNSNSAAVMDRRRREAMKKLKIRIDFVDKLPIEILSHVLSLAMCEAEEEEEDPAVAKTATTTMSDVITWMSVNKTWRRRIAECSRPWRRLVLRQSELDSAVCAILPWVGSHVQSLISVNYTSDRLLDHMKEGVFDHLCLLQLSFLGAESNPVVDPEDLSVALWQVRRTLTVLILQMGDSERVVPLSKLPRLLPNLIQLSYDTRRAALLKGQQRMPVCDIKVLRLVSPDIDQQDLDAVLESCPKLQQLFIYGLRDELSIHHLNIMYRPLLKKCVLRSSLP